MIKVYKNGQVSAYPPCKKPPTNSIQAGNVKKRYRLTWKHYRHISSSAVVLWEKKVNKLTFWTFTFREGTIKYQEAVKLFSKFLDNWKKTYGCKHYIWVGELTEKGTPHFHMIADIKFVDLKAVNAAFCKVRGDFSNSAVRLPQKYKNGKLVPDRSVVKNVGSLVRYLCKYLVKTIEDSQEIDFGGRVYAMSRGLTNNYRKYDTYDQLYQVLGEIKERGTFLMHCGQYCTTYSPTERLENVRTFIEKISKF